MALLHDWLPTWPRMRMPNRAVLPAPGAGAAIGFSRRDAAESYPSDSEPPEPKQETGKAEE